MAETKTAGNPGLAILGEAIPPALFVKTLIYPHPDAVSYAADGIAMGVETAISVGNVVKAARERDWPTVALASGTSALAGWATAEHVSRLRDKEIPDWTKYGITTNKIMSAVVIGTYAVTQHYINSRLRR